MSRALTVALSLALLAAPLAAQAQQAGKVYRVGLILIATPLSDMAGPEPSNPLTRAFVQGLRALGYVEGQNLILERRSAEGRFERFGDIVAELLHLRVDVELGGLMFYGVNLADNSRRAATFVDKILKGAKPADLPVEQPTRFDLVINLKAARSIGLTIPQQLLSRAAEVLQ